MKAYSIENRLLNAIKESGNDKVLLNGNLTDIDIVLILIDVKYYGVEVIDDISYYSFVNNNF
jgi:hypothetical protein